MSGPRPCSAKCFRRDCWQQYRKKSITLEKKLKQSILTSYIIGAPIGLFVVFATIFVPGFIFGEGLLTMVILGTYGISAIGLVSAFLISLWIGAIIAYKNIEKGKSLILTSFKYSTIVNLLIWSVFCLIIGFTVEDEKFLMMIPPIIAFLICVIITTFSIGLLISFIIGGIYNNKIHFKMKFPSVYNKTN